MNTLYEPPVIPDSCLSDGGLPLIRSGREILSLLPQWLGGQTLQKVIGSFSKEIDRAKEQGELVESALFLSPRLSEPRLAYESGVPQKVVLDTRDALHLSFYSNGAWTSLFRVYDQVSFEQAHGPCYWIRQDNQVLFNNLERQTALSTGSASGSLYVFDLSGLVPDKSVLISVSGAHHYPASRWQELTPEELLFSGQAYFSTSQHLYISKSIRPAASGFLIKWTSGTEQTITSAKEVLYENRWDILGHNVSIKRRPYEDNLSYRKRIFSVNLFSQAQDRKGLLVGSARALGTLSLLIWDGVTPINIATAYPQMSDIVLAGRPMQETAEEALSRLPGEDRRFSSSKIWDEAQILVDGIPCSVPWSASGAVITFDSPIQGRVLSRFSYTNYAVSGGYLVSTGNLPKGSYIVGVVESVSARTLAEISEDSLFELGEPTLYYRNLLSLLESVVPFGYNKVRWSTPSGRFTTAPEKAPQASRLALPFED